jgi:hypothetical protein
MARRGSRPQAARKRRASTALLVIVLCAAACGGDRDANSPLTAKERSSAYGALSTIDRYCHQVGRFFSRRGNAPTPDQAGAAERAVDELVALAKAKPAVEYRPGQTMRTLIGDTAENLEATGCSRPLVARLQQALASIPPAP